MMYLIDESDLEYLNEQLEDMSWYIFHLMAKGEIEPEDDGDREENFAPSEDRALEKSNSSADGDF